MANLMKHQTNCNCLDNLCNKPFDPKFIIINNRYEKIRSKFIKCLDTAISEARKGPMATQYGAVIFNENTGEIYAKGHNHWKSVHTNKALQCLLCT